MKNLFLVLVGVAIVAIGGIALMSKKSEPVTTMNSTPEVQGAATSPVVENTSAPAEAETQTITMDAGSFYYSVKEIKAKVGDRIKIVMTSKDMMHNFNIDELNVESPTAKSGETVEFEFTADKAGTFEYYCSIGQHRKNGQVGKLIVE